MPGYLRPKTSRGVGFDKIRARLIIIAFFSTLLWAMISADQSVYAVVDLADAPMFTRIQPPPANIMMLLDDSGSMSFEVLVKGQYDGYFPDPKNTNAAEGFCYIFENLGDGVYSDNWRYMDQEDRKYWKSQWSQINVMYYDPAVTYEPWPGYDTITFDNADTEHPRPHPVIDTGKVLDLDGKSFEVDGIVVKHAHYFVSYDGTIYLAVIDGDAREINYYTVGIAGTGLAEKVVSLSGPVTAPDEIKTGRSYAEERQNFANWYTYYHRREYTAKAAIARVIENMETVRVGIYGINQKIIVPLKPVKAVVEGEFRDDTDLLLHELYGFQSNGGTPLKAGLQTIGEYLKKNDGRLAGVRGDVPYPADGGGCQQSFVIVMTDGFYSDTTFNAKADNADGDNGSPYADPYTDTLADMAMYYYENDLCDYPDQVPTNKYDKAEHQHMVTYGLAFGVAGTLNPNDYELDPTRENYMKHKISGEDITWPQVAGVRQPQSIDDLWHAAVDGRGEFLNAGNPQQLINALDELMASISKRHKGSAASVTINGDQFYATVSDEIVIFQSSYNNFNEEWIGDVKAYHIDPATGSVLVDNPVWSAAGALDNKDPDARNILTYNGANAGGLFREDQLTANQKAQLGPNVAAMVDYLRGKPISGLRPRSQRLGDIVHSAPVFINNVVYAGANDGMLHAFDALNGGEEIFAYVPDLVFANLKELADTAYTHRYFVDLTPAVKKGKGILGGTDSQTILVGGLGKGGQGYFALDITSPASMGPSNVLWEFPNAGTLETDKADLGYSYSRPAVVQSYNPAYPWIIIFGNGYNSAGGKSVLFILSPNGTLIKKIEAGGGPDNGLSTPIAVDVNLNGRVDFAYAGDLKGNLWKFDLGGDQIGSWEVAYKDSAQSPQPLFQAKGPETDPLQAVQPITVKPDVMLHPNRAGLLVCFGTGRFLGDSDYADTTIHSVYGIWDYGDPVHQFGMGWSDNDDREYLGTVVRGSGLPRLSNQPDTVRLLKQEIQDYIVHVDGQDVVVRTLSNHPPSWKTQEDSAGQLPNPSGSEENHTGWFFDLSPAERVISDVVLRDGRLVAIGFTPDSSRCGHGGRSFFMEVNGFTGGRFEAAIFDINNDGYVGGTIGDQGDYINIGTLENPNWVPTAGILLPGNIQTPAIIGLGFGSGDGEDGTDHGGGGCREAKIFSSSSGEMPTLIEICAGVGVVYWKEVR